jgi:hypothetical protein
MFGVKLHQRRDLIEGLARALILSGQNIIGHQDQASLDKIVWPVAKYDVVMTQPNEYQIISLTLYFVILS